MVAGCQSVEASEVDRSRLHSTCQEGKSCDRRDVSQMFLASGGNGLCGSGDGYGNRWLLGQPRRLEFDRAK